MKIFHVLSHFLPGQIAGTELYVFGLQENLQQLGYEGGVIIPEYVEHKNHEYTYENIRVLCYQQAAATKDEIFGKAYPSGLGRFKKMLENEKPDLIHFHEITGSNGISIGHLEVVSTLEIPMVFTFHLVGYVCPTGTLIEAKKELCDGRVSAFRCTNCSYQYKGISPGLAGLLAMASVGINTLGLKMYGQGGAFGTAISMAEQVANHSSRLHRIENMVSNIIVPNDWYKEMLEKNGVEPEKISVIKHALFTRVQQVKPLQRSNVSHDEPLKLVFVGRIHWAKGLDVLLKALQTICDLPYRLDIYGPTNDNEYYKKCLEIIHGNENIRWMGKIPLGMTVDRLKEYDFLCVPSMVSETGPMVILEAFEAGISVIASNVFGNNNLVKNNENGWLFERGNIKELNALITRLIVKRTRLVPTASLRKFGDLITEYDMIYKQVLK